MLAWESSTSLRTQHISTGVLNLYISQPHPTILPTFLPGARSLMDTCHPKLYSPEGVACLLLGKTTSRQHKNDNPRLPSGGGFPHAHQRTLKWQVINW
ncbi:hypothetical protein E2C01_015292 [Portunus trituberculatus]|uniref:Uncharacterized protein n=1 Tax=Portunus trituberculatus TaxID=210409 RepID=A0A5B7DKY8_PORTR|nr:hypothetical protein [Portunus trituberculatus]